MYNLLIVDDEKIIREGILNVLNDQFDCFNAYAARDGKEALAHIKEEEIEGMILDIKMPVMDGLELLQQLDREDIEIPTLILSGYDEFEYAQKSLQYMAIDYVLKPVVPDDIRELCLKLKDEIKRRRKEKQEFNQLKSQVENSKSVVKEKLFYDILNGRTKEQGFKEKLDLLNLKFTGDVFKIILVEPEVDEPEACIENLIKNYFAEREACTVFYLNNKMFVLMFNYKSVQVVDSEKIYSSLENVQNNVRENTGVPLTIGIGEVCLGIDNVKYSYYQAYTALRFKISMGKGKIYNIRDLKKQGGSVNTGVDSERIITKLKLGDITKIEEEIKARFNQLENLEGKPDMYSIYILCNRYLSAFMSGLKEYNLNLERFYADKVNPFTEFLVKKSISELKNWLLEMLANVKEYIDEYQKEKDIYLVESIKDYINNNYEQKINNRILSEIVGYSPNYLGQVFKEETGITINEYLNKTRINKARDLLQNKSLMIYQIADKVGYNDQHYFSSVFKKFTGITPKEYREL